MLIMPAILGQQDDAVYAFVHEGMAATFAQDLCAQRLAQFGAHAGRSICTMELLDAGNTGPTAIPCRPKFRWGPKQGKAILSFRAMI
jgi:hydroxylamine reductase